MSKKSPHIGSSFESWLDQEGLRAQVTAAAIKMVVRLRRATKMKKAGKESATESR